MSNRSITLLLAGVLLAAIFFLVGADAEEPSGRYSIAATSAETAGGYILEVFVVDTQTGVVKHVVSDGKNQLGLPFRDMKPGILPGEG